MIFHNITSSFPLRLLISFFLLWTLSGCATDAASPSSLIPRNQASHTELVRVLVADWCPYCRKLKSELERGTIPYRLIDIESNEGRKIYNALGRGPVPITIIGKDVIRGARSDEIFLTWQRHQSKHR